MRQFATTLVKADGRFFELTDQGDGTRDGALVFRVAPDKVLAFGDEHGQTTYRP